MEKRKCDRKPWALHGTTRYQVDKRYHIFCIITRFLLPFISQTTTSIDGSTLIYQMFILKIVATWAIHRSFNVPAFALANCYANTCTEKNMFLPWKLFHQKKNVAELKCKQYSKPNNQNNNAYLDVYNEYNEKIPHIKLYQ